MYQKQYISMLIHVDTDGKISPVSLTWTDGRKYTVDRVLDTRLAPPPHVGGVLTECYECRFGSAVRALYREKPSGRCFVEVETKKE